jgi:hypothetical protein
MKMEIKGEDVAIWAGIIAILTASMKFLKYMFFKFSKIEIIEKEQEILKQEIKSVKESEIRRIENDLQDFKSSIDKDFQELKNAVQTAIIEGNASIEKTVSDLHIKLLDKITEINK